MNLFTQETHRHRKQTNGYQRGKRWEKQTNGYQRGERWERDGLSV